MTVNDLALLQERVNANPTLVRLGRWVSLEFLWGIGSTDYIIRLKQGRVGEVRARRLPTETGVFSVRAPREVWLEHWQAQPKPEHHDLFSMLSAGRASLDGETTPLMQNLIYFKGILAAPREPGAADGRDRPA